MRRFWAVHWILIRKGNWCETSICLSYLPLLTERQCSRLYAVKASWGSVSYDLRKWTGCHAHAPLEAGWVGGSSEHDHSFIYPITINNAFCDYVAAIILFIGKGWFTSWSCSLGSHFPNAALKGCRSWYEQKCGGKKKPNKQELTRVTEASLRIFWGHFRELKSPPRAERNKGKTIIHSSSKHRNCYAEENSEWMPD